MIGKHALNSTPPPTISQLSIIVKIKELYRSIYEIGFKIDKKNRYGIHKEIELLCLELLNKSIRAALFSGTMKTDSIREMRIITENLKHLIRLEYEIKIIPAKKYLAVEEILVEISKMALGWGRSIQKRRD